MQAWYFYLLNIFDPRKTSSDLWEFLHSLHCLVFLQFVTEHCLWQGVEDPKVIFAALMKICLFGIISWDIKNVAFYQLSKLGRSYAKIAVLPCPTDWMMMIIIINYFLLCEVTLVQHLGSYGAHSSSSNT